MDELLLHHIAETRDRFTDIKSDIHDVKQKLDDLNDFKVSLVASSRFVAFIVSAVCGLISLVASTIVTYYVNIKLTQ